jgi:hypothetical protein
MRSPWTSIPFGPCQARTTRCGDGAYLERERAILQAKPVLECASRVNEQSLFLSLSVSTSVLRTGSTPIQTGKTFRHPRRPLIFFTHDLVLVLLYHHSVAPFPFSLFPPRALSVSNSRPWPGWSATLIPPFFDISRSKHRIILWKWGAGKIPFY